MRIPASCLILYIVFLAQHFDLNAQKNRIDSLLPLQRTAKDSDLVDVYNLLSEEYRSSDPKQAMLFANRALESAQKLGYRSGTADSYNNIGILYLNQSDFSQAVSNFHSSLKLNEELGNQTAIAMINNNLGVVYYSKGDYKTTLAYFLRSLKARESLNDKKGISESYNNIGIVYGFLKNYDQALGYHLKSLKTREEMNDIAGQAASYSNIGIVYNDQGKNEQALDYHLKALSIRTRLGDKYGMANSYSNIGVIYHDIGNYESALEFHTKSLEIKEELKDKRGMAVSYTNIGSAYEMKKKYPAAIRFQTKAFELANEIGALETIKFASQSLASIYKATRNYEKALLFQEQYSRVKDSILNLEKLEEMAGLKADFEIGKKEQELTLIAKTKEAEQKAELDKQRTINRSVIIGGLLVLLLALVLYSGYRQKKRNNILLEEQKNRVEEANKKISLLNDNLRIIHEIDRSILAAVSLEDIANASLKYLLELYPAVERVSFLTFELDRNKAKMIAVSAKKLHSFDTGNEFDADSLTAYPELVKGEIKKVDDINALPAPSDSDKELLKQGICSYIMFPLLYENELIGSLNLSANTRNYFSSGHTGTIKEIGNELALAIQQFRFKEIIKNKNKLLEEKNKEIMDSIHYARRIQDSLLPRQKFIGKTIERLRGS
jgi:tetratricopeptide (TPR) repeat protein